MTRISEQLGVRPYLIATIKTLDGKAWILCCIASVICLLDRLFEINMIPLRDSADAPKAITLLLFSPLLVFLVLIWLRQLPIGFNRSFEWIRAVFCIVFFLLINF